MSTRHVMCGALLLLACGGDNADDGNSPSTDAGASGCSLFLEPPALANVGQEVEVGVSISTSIVGIIDVNWSIALTGSPQALTELAASPTDRVSFVPSEAGPYQVVVNATVGGSACDPATGTITVTATGALSTQYRMRIVPSGSAPMQDVPVQVFGGANAVLPTTTLEAGVTALGRVADNTGLGLPAYIRARKRGTSEVTDYEAFADSNGDFQLIVAEGRYDVSVIPSDGTHPALWLEDLDAAELDTTFSIPVAVTLSGQLLDAAGVGVANARVSLIVEGAQSTDVVTSGDGSFALLGAAGALTGVRVAPPTGSGLPSLIADTLPGTLITAGTPAVIRYAQPLVSAQVDLDLDGGAAAVAAQGEWRAALTAAGSVQVGVASPETLAGTLRVSATADGSGTLSTPLYGVNADFVAFSSDNSQALVSRDLPWGTSPTANVTLAPLVEAPMVVSAGGDGITAALIAQPLDVLAPQSIPPSQQTLADGSASLGLVQGGNYHIRASERLEGTVDATLSNAQPGLATTNLSLPGTIVASGLINQGTSVAVGAQVSLYCTACTGTEATRVMASGITDASGRYVLRIADPGVVQP